MASDILEMILEDGPLRMLFREMECNEDCNALNVFFYVKKNEVCTPHTVVAQKNADGIYTTDCEYRAFRKVPDNSRRPQGMSGVFQNVRECSQKCSRMLQMSQDAPVPQCSRMFQNALECPSMPRHIQNTHLSPYSRGPDLLPVPRIGSR
nr:odorant-binding protein-like isoform X5 [Oryctolagus cuniculus]